VPALTIINQHHHRHHIIGIQFKVEIKNLINTGLNGLKIENKSIIKRRRMRDNELCFVCLLFFFVFFVFWLLMDDTGLIKSNQEISIAYKVFSVYYDENLLRPLFFQ
jgi:hypothetical protein